MNLSGWLRVFWFAGWPFAVAITLTLLAFGVTEQSLKAGFLIGWVGFIFYYWFLIQ